MFSMVFFTIAQIGDQLVHQQNEWINQMQDMYTTEYYSAFKKGEILLFVSTGMSLEDMMTNEIKQQRQRKQVLYDLISEFKKVESTDMESRMVVTRGPGRRMDGGRGGIDHRVQDFS